MLRHDGVVQQFVASTLLACASGASSVQHVATAETTNGRDREARGICICICICIDTDTDTDTDLKLDLDLDLNLDLHLGFNFDPTVEMLPRPGRKPTDIE